MRSALLPSLLVLLLGCASGRKTGPLHASGQLDRTVGEEQAAADLAPVVAEAERHVGATSVRVGGRSFRYDCSGFVRGVFSTLGVDLFALGPAHPDYNGVRLIHAFMEAYGENHRRTRPRPGDVVYWDDTVDRNNDGLQNDPLTHVGLVVSVDEDGTITFIHRANKGIVREVMNLDRPREHKDKSGKKLNDYLRAKKRRDAAGARHLAGELWAGFGTLREIPAGAPHLLASLLALRADLALDGAAWDWWPAEE